MLKKKLQLQILEYTLKAVTFYGEQLLHHHHHHHYHRFILKKRQTQETEMIIYFIDRSIL